MSFKSEENIHLQGFVLGVLRSAEISMKYGNQPIVAQNMINELLDEKMKFRLIKRIAKVHKIEIDWKSLDITIKRTD